MYAYDIMKYLADEGFSAESGDESSAVSVASFHPPTDKNEFLFKCTELVKLIESGLELFRTVDNRFAIYRKIGPTHTYIHSTEILTFY